jgi:predicted HTH transcriptional regulator
LPEPVDAVNELCKDVSAMANAAGGQIIYGIEENKANQRALMTV